jgi:hypothetical protein
VNLAGIFAAVAHKELVAVDLPGAGSNQHELNGVAALRDFFGTTGKLTRPISWHLFRDGADPLASEGSVTFYDARAASAHSTGRTEWRLYYSGWFLGGAEVGDLLVFARATDDRLFGLCFQRGSSWHRAACALFGIDAISPKPTLVPNLSSEQLTLARQQLLEELELAVPVPASASDEDLVVEQFGLTFPTTAAMSAFARTCSEVDWRLPDEALAAWLDREEQLFRALETLVINQQLANGFRDADHFIEYSLSVQNRRKSRRGHSLQNHLAHLFTLFDLRFTGQGRTERGNRPDFLFPGEAEYHDLAFDTARLTMLGAKSTLKDRWRQVLAEADRIPAKHLCTLDTRISESQSAEIAARQLTLVVPTPLAVAYTDAQRRLMLDTSDFIQLVSSRQSEFAPSPQPAGL